MQRSRTPRAHLVLQYRCIVRELSGLTFVGGQMPEYKSNHRPCWRVWEVYSWESEAECYRAQTLIKPAVQPPSHPQRR